MPRKQPRAYRKQRTYRRPRQQSGMRRMEGVLVDTARMGLMIGATGAIVNMSANMYKSS
ncbi:MAG: hypothetical protein M0Q91_18775 [Methanoregula sp.]|nr:hypothetical protein [Methanoregula sp.]